MIAVLPTLLTLANAACGFGAITIAARLGPESAGSDHLLIASLLIFLGMVFDMLDGSAARLTHQTSDLGAQLDSLCDAITFGVAPAILMLQFVRYEHAGLVIDGPELTFPARFVWTVGILYVLGAVMRLARFNVETEDEDSHESFSGLPSPAAAGVVASFPVAIRDLLHIAETTDSPRLAAWLVPGTKLALVLATLGVACLMVSRVRYPHVFNQWFRGHRSRRQMIQLVFTAAAVYWVHELAVMLVFCWFAFATPGRMLWGTKFPLRLYRSSGV